MDDDGLYIVFFMTLIIMLMLAVLTLKFTDKVNELDKRVDDLEKQVHELHSETDAIQERQTEEITTEAKEEPKTATKEVRKELRTEERTTEAPTTEAQKKKYVGEYELTAYIATGSPCADGNFPQVGWTVASNDPQLWHKKILIEGYGEYYVHDTGGMSVSTLDVFVGSYDEAIQFGRRSAAVYILE